MRQCLVCSAIVPAMTAECPMCGSGTPLIDGFECYASEFAHGGGGFKANYFEELAGLEASNFWFRARNELVIGAIQKYWPSFRTLLEIGCGTGYVLNGISRSFPGSKLVGSEIFLSGLGFASKRVPSAHFIQMDARRIPYMDEFDIVGAFDVLEHIDDDVLTLRQIHKALHVDGLLVLTVPQHPWLWSPVDEYACHERRYDATSLHRKLRDAGFQILRSTSFVTLLLPAMAMSRYLQSKSAKESFDAASELKIPRMLNEALYRLLRLEMLAIRLGINFPIGGSRLVIAKKSSISQEQ